ncbi:MAG: hypothetical protein KC484_05865 [Colwelliaceae bacterium]|nr:hypothetical protein [Colwelliaceae bacterium]
MQFSDNTLKLLFAIFSTIMFGLYIISFFTTGDAKSYQFILGLSGLLFSYKFSEHYKSKNAIEKLIKRKDEKLEISSIKLFPFTSKLRVELIEVSRISIASIGKDWLSIIIDGNGNGFDFQLLGSQRDIETHIKSLLIEQEASKIDFRYI